MKTPPSWLETSSHQPLLPTWQELSLFLFRRCCCYCRTNMSMAPFLSPGLLLWCYLCCLRACFTIIVAVCRTSFATYSKTPCDVISPDQTQKELEISMWVLCLFNSDVLDHWRRKMSVWKTCPPMILCSYCVVTPLLGSPSLLVLWRLFLNTKCLSHAGYSFMDKNALWISFTQ